MPRHPHHRNISRSRAPGTRPLENGTHMSLSDRIKEPPARVHGLDCSIGRLLNTLEGDELAALLTMLGDEQNRGWSQNDIYEALTAEKHVVGRQTINRHRGKTCRCFKAAA